MDKRYSDFVEALEDIVSDYDDSSNEYEEVMTSLTMIKNRLEDETLYLGAVGSFSSGKSTFLNSMIQKNLLPTDAVQGTTVSATILKKAEKNDLIIHYSNGQILSYSDDIDIIAERYGLEVQKEHISIWKRLLNWLKRLFGIVQIKEDNSQMRELFLDLISNEERAKDVQQVVLNIKNENIPYNIGLVDTPGTESLNFRHNAVTRNVIENICDAIVIIIPYDEPVSEELLSYVNGNIKEYIDNCIFVVTKVELLDDIEELPRLMKVIKKRLENGLDISNPIVLPMPTLLYLKNVDTDVKITLLEDIDEENRLALLNLYKQGYEEIYNILDKNREQYLRKKLISVCEQVSRKLLRSLQEKVQQCEQVGSELIKNQVVELSEFKNIMVSMINSKIIYCVGSGSVSKTNIRSVYSEMKTNIDGMISNIWELDILASEVSGIETNIAINQVEKILKAPLESIQNSEHEVSEVILEEFMKEYESCGNLNTSIFLNTEFDLSILEEYKLGTRDSFEKMKDNIVIHIKSQSEGLVNKFKALFKKNIKKEREYVISALYSYLNEEEEHAVLFVEKWNESIKVQIRQQLLFFLEGLLDINRTVISQYCEENISSIRKNQSLKMRTEENIDKLENYLNILRED